jgi:signal transduction histidine kinase
VRHSARAQESAGTTVPKDEVNAPSLTPIPATRAARIARVERTAALGSLGGLGHELDELAAVMAVTMANVRHAVLMREPLRGDDLLDLEHVLERLDLHAKSLLALGRPEARPQQGVDVAELATEVLASLQASGCLRHATATGHFPDAPIFACVDRGRLEQVLVHVVRNAAEAVMPGGRIVVEAEQARTRIRCRVVDDGCGLAKETLERIFEPYFTTKPRERSHGLGLCTVRRIVSAWGGEITVRSRPGRGTTVEIDMPA